MQYKQILSKTNSGVHFKTEEDNKFSESFYFMTETIFDIELMNFPNAF